MATRFIPIRLHGSLRLLVFSGERDAGVYNAKIVEALDLIERVDKNRFIRINRDLRGFALVADGGDYYDADLRYYVVHLPALIERSIEQIALTIVHEATHARLRRAGVASTRDNAARIERICVDQEVTFAARLPGAHRLAAEAVAKLSEVWWTTDKTDLREDRMLASVRVPNWAIRWRRRLLNRPARSDNDLK